MHSFARRLVAATAVLAVPFALTQPAVAQALELRLGTGTPPSHVWTRAAERFAQNIATATDGEITITVFPAAQLGPESDQLQQMQAGVLDMGIISAAAVSSRAPAFLAWFSPFAIDDVAGTVEAAQSDTAAAVLGELQPLGLRGLGYVFAGMRHILLADGTVESLADLEGKKIRITPFPGMQTWWAAAGAVPTPVQLGDVYQSLSSGLIDGVDIDLDALVGFSMQQVADTLVVTNHMAFPGVALITESAFGRMSEEQQATFMEVMAETLGWAADLQIETDASHLKMLEGEMNVIRLENAEGLFSDANAAFAEAFSDIPLVVQFGEELGR
ncbi:MAG: TRAP transporter substrate-binding protein [Pseudomonadota bacterium]